MRHYLKCEAAICKDDPNPSFKEEVVWYAGERVCTKAPYTKFQKKQIAINAEVKKGTFRLLDTPYNAHALETRSI